LNELINKTNQTPIEIALGIDGNGMTTARKLYDFLELNNSNYAKWYQRNILENQFATENEDYIVFVPNDENPQGGRPTQDFKLTASFAKKLSMTAKNEKGEQARNYFIQAESKLKELALKSSGVLKNLSPELQAIFAHDKKLQFIVSHIEKTDNKVDSVDRDLQSFKKDMPLLALECAKITGAKNQKVVPLMGGKHSPAYKNRSLTKRVYRDLEAQLKREFGVDTYKAIKRNQCSLAIEIIKNYQLPLALKEEIADVNAQIAF